MKFTSVVAAICLISASINAQDFQIVEDRSGLTVATPALANRTITKLRLKNGLEAYLISDPGVEQSAAALSVEVGSWHDPKEYAGMAHFLEHMLFMGNAAYPDESEYMRYISDNGGIVNAYTASDRTVYMFSVNNAAFEGGVDRFSHFFIDPLFNPSCINRELHAVDQEHAKNLENDSWRQYMILKETGNPNHPNAKFSTGNAATLKGIPQEAMKSWYKKHYSATRMHLVLLSALPMDQLVQMAVSKFSAVPVSKESLEKIDMPLFSNKQKGHLLYLKPVKDLKVLSLTWEIPRNLGLDKEIKAGDLIAYALRSASPGSLYDVLKKAHLAENLNAECASLGKEYKLMNIEIELSDQGIEKVDQVIASCFSALNELRSKGIPSYAFDEICTLQKLKYEYQSRQEAFEFVREHADSLIDEPLETYPLKSLVPNRFDAKVINQWLQELTVQNCFINLIASPEKTKVEPSQKEKWMSAEYTLKAIPQKQMIAWNTPSTAIMLPQPNPYVPVNIPLLDKKEPTKEKLITPTLIAEDASSQIYYAPDDYYLVPEIAHSFRLKSPLIDGTARSTALTDLYLKSLNNKLSNSILLAQASGIQAQIIQENLHLLLTVGGVSVKAPVLIKEIFGTFKTVKPTREEFNLYVESLKAQYANASKELPLMQSMEMLSSIIFNCSPTSSDKLGALSKISYEDYLSFCSEVFNQGFVEALLFGNLSETDAKSLSATLMTQLALQPYPKEQQHKRKVLALSSSQGPYMMNLNTPMQGHAALLLIEEGRYTFEKRAAQQVLAKAVKEDFFDTLRTKQQTAYIARAWATEEEGQMLHLFAVQSSSHQPTELIARFELFLESFLKHFEVRIPLERFENIRAMQIATLEMRPENLINMSRRLTSLAFDYGADFALVEKRIASLKALNYEQIYSAAETFFSRNNRKRLAILTQGVLPTEKDFHYEMVTKQALQEKGSFLVWK